MHLPVVAIGVGVLIIATVASAQGDDAQKELESLQGKWEVTKVIFDGMATDNLKGVQTVFDKDKMSLIGAAGTREFRIKLDPTKKPRALDMTALDGEFKDKTNLAVYKMEGDLLNMCWFNEPGWNKRPTELSSTEGSKLLLVTLKRSK